MDYSILLRRTLQEILKELVVIGIVWWEVQRSIALIEQGENENIMAMASLIRKDRWRRRQLERRLKIQHFLIVSKHELFHYSKARFIPVISRCWLDKNGCGFYRNKICTYRTCKTAVFMQIFQVLIAVVFVHEKACLTFRRHRACRMPCVSCDVTIADTIEFCLKFPIHSWF